MVMAYSKLMQSLNEGKFVYTGELEPVKTTSLHEVLDGAKKLKDYVVAANITDNPGACAYMNSLIPSYLVQKEVGLETVYQVTVRDRNRIALISDLLAAGALGIKNILALTGDHTTVGDNPQAQPVFDLDSATFVYMLRKMVDDGVDLNNNKIDKPPKFNIGIAGNPNSNPLNPELLKIERKVKLGADFMQTQVVFEMEPIKSFLKEIKKFKIPILVGLFPCKSYGVANFFDKHIPGVHVPKEYMDELKKTSKLEDKRKRKNKYDEINLEFTLEFIKELRKTTHTSGIHIMAVGYERLVKQIVENIQ